MTLEKPDDRKTMSEIQEKYLSHLSKEYELTIDEVRKIFNECDTKLISGGGYKARQFMKIALVPAIERYKKAKQNDNS